MKKNLLLLTVIFFISFTVHAQINKGSVFLGGSLSFGHTTGEPKPSFGFSPQVGTTFKENDIAGLILIYSNGGPYINYDFNSYGGGLFLRKYRQLGKNFYLFGHGQFSYLFFKSIAEPNPNEIQTTKQSTYSLSIFPGLSYAFSRKFHIDVTINNLLYISYNKTNKNYSSPGSSLDTKSNSFFISTNNQTNYPFSLGFNLIL